MFYLKKYLAELVYGAIDGTVTTFAVIAGAIGASLNPGIVVVLGFANLFADGFSMAVSNYLSMKSSNDLMETGKNPLKTAFATFISFIFVGFIPLFSFVAAFFSSYINDRKFLISIILTGSAFLFIGWVRAAVVKKGHLKSALETLCIGGIAAVIAFVVGFLLKDVGAL